MPRTKTVSLCTKLIQRKKRLADYESCCLRKQDGSCLLWVMLTEISVDIAVDIAVDSRSIVGRQSVDSRSIVGRQSVDSRSMVGP